MIITLALLGCAFLLPIPIAVAFRLRPVQALGPSSTPTLARLIWICLALASLLAAHGAFLAWILARSPSFRPPIFFPEVFAVWVPWVLLARFLSPRPAAAYRIGAQRSASLKPRDHTAPARWPWNVAMGLWIATAAMIGSAAWLSDRMATAGMLLGAALVWLLFGRRHARTIVSVDPQPLAERSAEHLRRCYRRRQALTAWTLFAVFSTLAASHAALAAAWTWWPNLLWPACVAGAVVLLGVIAIVHGQYRRRLDARIDVLLSGEGSTSPV